MRYLTAQKRVMGLGTAHSGTGHFIEQRLSAMALIILIPLFLILVAPYIGDSPEDVKEAFRSCMWVGLTASATVLLVGLHVAQGLQVVIEDYVHGFWGVMLLALMRIGTLILVLATLWAIVLISLS